MKKKELRSLQVRWLTVVVKTEASVKVAAVEVQSTGMATSVLCRVDIHVHESSTCDASGVTGKNNVSAKAKLSDAFQ